MLFFACLWSLRLKPRQCHHALHYSRVNIKFSWHFLCTFPSLSLVCFTGHYRSTTWFCPLPCERQSHHTVNFPKCMNCHFWSRWFFEHMLHVISTCCSPTGDPGELRHDEASCHHHTNSKVCPDGRQLSKSLRWVSLSSQTSICGRNNEFTGLPHKHMV